MNYDSADSVLQSKSPPCDMIAMKPSWTSMMKLKYETVIDASLETVWAAFDNPDNMSRWQQNLESFSHISGEPGQPGAVSELVYDEKGKKLILKETITERREPYFLAGTYESPVATTLVVNHFEAIDENSTRWTSWSNLTNPTS